MTEVPAVAASGDDAGQRQGQGPRSDLSRHLASDTTVTTGQIKSLRPSVRFHQGEPFLE